MQADNTGGGDCRQFGQGVPQEAMPDGEWDYSEAMKWYRKAAEQEHANAQSNLGFMYAQGQGVTQDYAEALRWFRKAAEQGEAPAQFNLGLMYRQGHGVTQDDAEAGKWYRKAGEQGLAQAQFILGRLSGTA